MIERRSRRSADPTVALQYLVESVAERSDVDAIAIVDAAGAIVAGSGCREPLRDLARLAHEGGVASPRFEVATQGTDYFGRDAGTVGLVAFGTRVPRLPQAVRAVKRILEGVES